MEATSTSSAISRELVRLLAREWGRGPTRAHTTYTRDTVTCVLDDFLLPAEAGLVAAGRGSEVLVFRRALLDVVRPQISGRIAELTGRAVVSLLGDADPDGNTLAIVAVLGAGEPTNGVEHAVDGAATT